MNKINKEKEQIESTSDEFTGKYAVTKTVRFELKPSRKMSFPKGNIEELKKQLTEIKRYFLKVFLEENNEKEIQFKKQREIKYGWLRSYTKNDFYSWKEEKGLTNKEKKYELRIIDYLFNEFLRWSEEWDDLVKILTNSIEKEEHTQERRSEIAFCLKGFMKRSNFEFIKEFVFAITDNQKEKGIQEDKALYDFRELLRKSEENLKTCAKEYLPAQSGGVLLQKASLNYYTLNKTPKEYEKLKKEKEIEKNQKLPQWIYNREEFNHATKRKEIVFSCDNDWLVQIKLGLTIKEMTLEDTYFFLKIWKAKQKSEFIEAVAGDKLSVLNFRTEFPLFDTTDKHFEEFYKLTKELDKAKGEDAKKIAQERGEFFNAPMQKVQTRNYFELCELYKRIAMKRGKIIAEIKGIENERVQSQLLTHWAVMAEKEDQKFVILIPRGGEENHKKAHDFLEKQEARNQKKEGYVLYHFKSLTLRALEKLCFKEIENTFRPELEKEGIPFPRYREEGRSENQEKYDQKMINFYKNILQSQYAKTYLDLVDFGSLKDILDREDFKDLEEFGLELERVCYTKVRIHFSEEQIVNFCKALQAKIFEMTTRSIERNKKENIHAKIWKEFWSNRNKEKNYEIRLNPEMSIFYRDALDNSEGNENRFSKPRFTLATTITLNANEKKSNISFKTIEDIKDNIDAFNKDFNESFSGEWVFGIDRGLKELATLNVVKFEDTKNEYKVSKPKEFAQIPVYKLIDEEAILKDKAGNILRNIKEEERKIIDNISEVLEEGKEPDANVFEKNIVSSIDLTQAKLIKGHIIVNGDQKTYLKLKELSAKRRIFELWSHCKIEKGTTFSFRKTIIIEGTENRYPIYWLTEKQKSNQKEKTELEKALKKYLQTLDTNNQFEDIETIEKINHLRDAITANMVGILYHLQSTIGKGFIALENMDIAKKELEKRLKEKGENEKDLETGRDKKIIDEHFDQSNQDISRRLEWALFRKFANSGDVPPQIKQSIVLRDDFEMYQIGILKYVKIGGTSSNCPNCAKRSGKTNGHFICKSQNDCGFSSKENKNILEQNLSNSDEVAAYNVAKNSFDDF